MSRQTRTPPLDRRSFIARVTGAALVAGAPAAALMGTAEGRIRTAPESAGDRSVAQAVGDQEIDLTKRAFTELVAGKPDTLLEALDERVQWRAVAVREFSDGVTLDRRGAKAYVDRMARSIASGDRRLELRSITPEGSAVRVVSAWFADGKVQECANVVQFAGGKVVNVVEAMS